MYLNSYIIAEHLDGVVSSSLRGDPLTAGLSHIAVLDARMPIEKGCIYILGETELAPFPSPQVPYTVVCAGEAPEFLRDDSCCDIICCRKTYSVSMIARRLLSLMEKYAQWETDLTQALLDFQDLDYLCELSVSIFKNPILILGPSYEILGVGQEGEKYRIPYEYREKSTDFLAENMIIQLSADPGYHKTFDSTNPQYYCDAEDEPANLCVNVFVEDCYSARIMIESIYRNVNESDWRPLLLLRRYVRDYLELNASRNYNNLFTLRQKLILYIDKREEADRKTIEYSLKKINWNVQGNYFCIFFQPGEHSVWSKTIQHECNLLGNSIQGSLVMKVDQRIFMICNIDKLALSMEELKQKIAHIIREHVMKAGYSTEFHDFFNYPAFYHQAKAALEFAKEKMDTSWQCHFRECYLEYVLHNGTHSLPPAALIPQQLYDLILYDRKHHTEYFDTLCAYLENQSSVVMAIEALHIHRSTFKYRMERLREFLDESVFLVPEERLYYLIIIQLIKELGDSLEFL